MKNKIKEFLSDITKELNQMKKSALPQTKEEELTSVKDTASMLYLSDAELIMLSKAQKGLKIVHLSEYTGEISGQIINPEILKEVLPCTRITSINRPYGVYENRALFDLVKIKGGFMSENEILACKNFAVTTEQIPDIRIICPENETITNEVSNDPVVVAKTTKGWRVISFWNPTQQFMGLISRSN